MKENDLVSIDIIREKVSGYVKEIYGEEKCLFDPIFRIEEGKCYLGYMVVDFVNEQKEDYRIKRPTKWLLVNMKSGDLYNSYDSSEKDYTNMPVEKIFDNNGGSKLFDSSNLVASSFLEWKDKIIKELEIKFNSDFKDMKILKIKDDMISPSEFVLSNVDSVLDEIHEEMIFKLGGKIQKFYKDYYDYLIDQMRKEYLETGTLNKEIVSSYIELMKYLWPDFIDIIDAFNNVN